VAKIKLFVCCHQPAIVPAHPLLVPIQVGAELTQERFPGFIYDDTGNNISQKNCSYCELTAQYWAWKNIEADYYGFFHYRRYLYPGQREKRPYRIEKESSLATLERLDYARFAELIPQYDLILPRGENMYVPVREHYANAPCHHVKDLKLAERIVQECFPAYQAAMDAYLSQTICYFGNIFIMKKQIFFDYCGWLFSILQEFDRQADTAGYGPQERRVNGYLAERLLGVYAAYQRQAHGLRITELPRVHFAPDTAARWRKQVFVALLPPGSRRRAWGKTIVTNWRQKWARSYPI